MMCVTIWKNPSVTPNLFSSSSCAQCPLSHSRSHTAACVTAISETVPLPPRCQCNGHADTCIEHDGTGCPCQNNTETVQCPSTSSSDRKDCYRQQVRCRAPRSQAGACMGGNVPLFTWAYR